MGILADLYTPVFHLFGENEALVSVVGSYIVAVSSFWLIGGLFLIVDVTGKPDWLMKYKVQEDQNVPTDMKKLKKALRYVAMNNLVINWGVGFVMLFLQMALGCPIHPRDLPTWPVVLRDFIVFGITQEFVFYYTHRLLHHPLLYKHVHKKHHEWTAPIGIVSIYTHPVEYLTGNMLTIITGPLLMRSHLAVFWMWLSLATFVVTVHHSGYHFPLLPSPRFHDFHHLKFNVNYGTLGFLDRFHGTDKMFRQSVESQRHRTLLGLTPMPQIFPDKKTETQHTKQG